MGAHSLPRTHQTHAGRIAGTGVLAALTLAGTAGTAGVALAHGDGDGEHGHGSSSTTVTTHRSSADTGAADGVLCDVLGSVDVPGISCGGDTSTGGTLDTVAQRAEAAPGRVDRGPRDTGSASRNAPAPSSTPAVPQDGGGAQNAGGTQATDNAQNAGGAQSAGGTQDAQNGGTAVQPKTSGNPIDAPGEPGTTRTLPIGG